MSRGRVRNPAQPIRVLAIVKTLDRGGAETLLLQQVCMSEAADIEYRVGYVRPSAPRLLRELEGHVPEVRCLGSESSWDPTWLLRLRSWIRHEAPDVVHVHSPLVASLGRLMVRSFRRRPTLVVTDHSVTYDNGMTRLADRATRGLDDIAIAVSAAVAEQTRSRHRAPHMIIHGVDLARVDAAVRHRSETRRMLGIADGDLLVVTVANARSEKDYPNLVRAAGYVCRGNSQVRFVAAGGGPRRSEIARLVDQSGLGSQFRYMGEVPQAMRLTAAADVFALASAWEGLPLVLMEALAAGTPVAATDVGGVRELVVDGQTGLLVPPRSPRALAQAILTLAGSPSTRTAMSAAAHAQRGIVDARQATRRIEQLYRAQVTGGR